MPRSLNFADIQTVRAVHVIARDFQPDVLHGHGAKGGAYARLAGSWLRRQPGKRRAAVFYTPHGGSLHFDPATVSGAVFMALERRLAGEKVGEVRCPTTVVANGLLESEFGPHAPFDDAADVLFLGELRVLKGVDVLLRALAQIGAARPGALAPRALIVGDGPDGNAFRQLAQTLGLGARVTFAGAMPAQQAFSMGRCLAMPSRAESFPYVVLEAAARALRDRSARTGGRPRSDLLRTRRTVPGARYPL